MRWIVLVLGLWIGSAARATCIPLADPVLARLDEQLIVDPASVIRQADGKLSSRTATDDGGLHRASLLALFSEGYYQLERDPEARAAAVDGLFALGNTKNAALQTRLRLAQAQAADSPAQIAAAIADVSRVLNSLPQPSVPHACALITRARMHNEGNRIDLAVADAIAAHREAEAGGWAEPRALAAEVLGWAYADSGDLEEARAVLDEAIEYAQSKRATMWMSILYFGYSRMQLRQHDWNAAIDKLRQSISLAESIGDDSGAGFVRSELCYALVQRGDYDAAAAECGRAERELSPTDRVDLKKSVLAMRAQLERVRGQPAAAVRILNTVLDQDGRDVPPKDVGDYYRDRAKAYEALGDFPHAYRDLAAFMQTERTQNELDRRRSIVVMRTRLETDRARARGDSLARQNELQREQLQAQRERTALSIALAGFAIAIAGLLAQSMRLRERHTRELGKREAELRTLALNAPDWLMLLRPDLTVRFSSRTADGPPPGVLVDAYLPAIAAPEQAKLMRLSLEKALSGSTATSFDFTLTDGEQRETTYECNAVPVLQDSQAVGLVLRCTDVTASRLAEELRRTQALVLETMHDGVVLIERNGTIRLSNAALRQMIGWKSSSPVNFNIKDLGIPLAACFAASRADGTGAENSALEFNCRRIDGSHFQAHAEFGPMSINDEELAIGIIQDISERKRLEAQLTEVSSREQLRIASDLHDGVGQQLTGVALLLRSVVGKANTARELQAVLNDVIAHVNSAIENTRTLAQGLAPLQLDGGSLGMALGSLAKHVRKVYQVEVVAHCDPQCVPLAPGVALHLYRIAQEAVINAAKHAGGTQIELRLTSDAVKTVLSILDNGSGLARADAERAAGLGLRLMRYRSGLIGGSFHVSSDATRGTEVSCSILHAVSDQLVA